MGELYTGDHAYVYQAGEARATHWRGYSFSAKSPITITHLIGSCQAKTEDTTQQGYVGLFEITQDAIPKVVSELRSCEILDVGYKQVFEIESLELEANKRYLVAQGSRSYFERFMGATDYFDPSAILAAHPVLNEWQPLSGTVTELFWGWPWAGTPLGLIDEEPEVPLTISAGPDSDGIGSGSAFGDLRPDLGFIYEGFNIWVKKGGEWLQVTDIWVKKGGAWQPVSSVDVNKDGWKPI